MSERNPERTRFSVGSYARAELGAVTSHALSKGIGYETVQGPRENFPLADGSKISVPEGQTAVVLIANGPETVSRFWDDFPYPEDK